MLFRTIEDRDRTLIRKRGRLITKFIPFTRTKVKPNYLPRILSETVSSACFCTFLHASVLSSITLPCCSIRSSDSDCTQFHAISKFTILKFTLFTFNAGESLQFFSYTKNIEKKDFFLHLFKKMSRICVKLLKNILKKVYDIIDIELALPR